MKINLNINYNTERDLIDLAYVKEDRLNSSIKISINYDEISEGKIINKTSLMAEEGLTNFVQTAKLFNIKTNSLTEFLIEHDLIYRDENKTLIGVERFVDDGLLEKRPYYRNKHSGSQTLITLKGRIHIARMLGFRYID